MFIKVETRRKEKMSRQDKILKVFLGTWAGTTTPMFISNLATSRWKRDDQPKYETTALRTANSFIKSYILGFPIFFIPTMVVRSSYSLYYKDSGYLVPPFFYQANEHPKYSEYVNTI